MSQDFSSDPVLPKVNQKYEEKTSIFKDFFLHILFYFLIVYSANRIRMFENSDLIIAYKIYWNT